MFHRILIVLLFCLSALIGSSQYMNITTGVLSGQNGLDFSPTGDAHKGYRFGVDMSMMGGTMYFLAGLHYMQYDINPISTTTYFDHNSRLRDLKGRFGLGFDLVNLTPAITLRAKLMGSIHYIDTVEDDIFIPSPYTDLNEAFGGVDIGIGLKVYAFTIDIEYEKGVINAVNMAGESNFDFLYFTVGFCF